MRLDDSSLDDRVGLWCGRCVAVLTTQESNRLVPDSSSTKVAFLKHERGGLLAETLLDGLAD